MNREPQKYEMNHIARLGAGGQKGVFAFPFIRNAQSRYEQSRNQLKGCALNVIVDLAANVSEPSIDSVDLSKYQHRISQRVKQEFQHIR